MQSAQQQQAPRFPLIKCKRTRCHRRNTQGEVTRWEQINHQLVELLTSFPSAALPGDKDALVLVLVPQRAVGLVRQGVAARQRRRLKHLELYVHYRFLLNKRDISEISTVYNCNMQRFPSNGVMRTSLKFNAVGQIFCKISSSDI